jgi:Ca-activated chloride channel homolog
MLRLLLLCLALLLAACNPEPTRLKLVAGSEVKDLEPILAQMEKDIGIGLDLSYSGTLDGVERIRGGEAFDAAWFSHAKYLKLEAKQKIQAEERIMLSPVVMGVKRSVAQKLNWIGKRLTWADIANAAENGNLRFAMTNPVASNSGFTALMGVHAALSGNNATLKKFFNGQRLTAGSSGWLAEAFVREQDNLDGMINYESVLLSLQAKLREPLLLLYPKEGIVTADYPLVLLESGKRESYQKVVDYLRSDKIQQQIMDTTLRRPAVTSVQPSGVFPKDLLVELPFPATANEVGAILNRFLSEQRRPAHSVFVLDVSGSMEGERIEALKNSMKRLAGADTSLSGRYSSFQNREKVTLIPFSSRVATPETTLIRGEAERQILQQTAAELRLGNGTAIYDALRVAYRFVEENVPLEPNANWSVVLMSDGENNSGDNYSQFATAYARLPTAAKSVKLFPILFGEANKSEMNDLATLTGGRVFDGTKSLEAAFKEIRGYQ